MLHIPLHDDDDGDDAYEIDLLLTFFWDGFYEPEDSTHRGCYPALG